jgi:hypothetical protein
MIYIAGELMLIEENGLPKLDQYSEEGFVDCVLKIASVEETSTHYLLSLRGSLDGQPVGFEVDLVKGIKSGLDADVNLIQEHVYRRGVVFRSSGEESDRLLNRLAVLYGLEATGLRMVDSESFTAIALHQGDIDISSEPIKIKIFGRDAEPLDEDKYNETFFNVDLVGGFVYWNEKDQDYREPLIAALTK